MNPVNPPMAEPVYLDTNPNCRNHLNDDYLTKCQKEYRDVLLHGNNPLKYFLVARRLEKAESRPDKTFFTKNAKSTPWFKRHAIYCAGTSINIFVMIMDRRRTFIVEPTQTLRQILSQNNLTIDGWYSIGGRPVQLEVPIEHYGVIEGSTITQHVRLCGGSTATNDDNYRVYTHIRDCEQQVLSESFVLQADDRIMNDDHTTSLMDAALKLVESLRSISNDNLWMCDLLENFFQVAYWTRRCQSKADYITCTMLSYKLLTGKSVSASIWKAFDTTNLQDDMFTRLTHDMRDLFSTGSLLLSNPILKKLRQIYTYLLVQGFLSHFGKDMNVEEFLKLDARVKVDYKSKTNMVMLIIETALTICERIDAYRLTGDWHALIHEDAAYTGWVKDAERLINLAPFTANLAAHGTTYFSFVSDLADTIEKGEAICKYSTKNSGVESVLMRKRLNSLQMLKNVEITRRASQKERKAPFGVLIHGDSSVAKSTFTKMLFYYYGGLHGLSVDDHFRYVRNPTDEYWSNFDSSKWCIQMDDIAFLLPSKSSDVDATLKEMLNVVNNVPYVPPQAALEDKGKTPVMAKLVIATTNAPDLNALDYFHCPLAVRRRLPYVVRVVPKDEYKHANGKFIDPTKLPKIEGQFPDYWNIEVQKLVPIEHNGRDSATLETIRVYSDVRLFLKDFARASLAHEATQEKSDVCDVAMKELKVCRLCYEVGEECECLQALHISPFTRVVVVYITTCVVDIVSRVIMMFVCTWVYAWLARFFVVRNATVRLARFLNKGVEIKIHSLLNRQRDYKFKLSVKMLLQAGLVLTNLFVCYKAGQYVYKATTPTPEPGKAEEDELCPQGNVLGTTEEQLEKEETKNVWYNPTLELSTFDVPLAARSLSQITPSGIRDLLAQNCVRIEVHALDAQFATRMGAIFLKGQYLCFNRHALRQGSRFRITIISMSSTQGLSSNVTIYLDRSEVKEIVERDIVVVRAANVPPRKDILKYWNNTQVPCTHMVSVRRERDGTVGYHELFNVALSANFEVESLNTHMDVYMGTGLTQTSVGDCGSIGVAITPKGPIILGLHTLGHNYTAAFPHVLRDQLEVLCDNALSCVEGGGKPRLALNGDVQLLPPHHKSVLRYLSEGTVNIYGSFPGFRPKPKSRVCATPLRSEMQKHFECDIAFGQPVMTGWQPIFNNVVEMVKPYTDVEQNILDHCVESYTKDILQQLTINHGNAWKGELVFLSDRAAVNGLPGVKFIDRLNVSTSMGHPWACSKKKYLEAAPDEIYPEGVDFDNSVWERVNVIKQLYGEGKRAYPVFTGHLKDEATSFAKIEACKTRIFTGAPVDWSLVVRSRLLSFVRLMQKNKLTFEAAPGTVAQSIEWSHFHTYLTHFGEDRMVAGDYTKYDKHMIATFVLAAFDIIARVHKEAGFTPEEIREIYCIGMDTAFPMTNVAGDLIEFYGTNPSGHPLTVIINSLVNSLYMRYAYAKLNPDGPTCTKFREHVNLLTYGDDNAFGVSRNIEWFHHTSIQTALKQIGVGYTMAEKGAQSRPFIHIGEISFLKRTWRFEEELQMYVCPLEEASIHKSLTTWVPSQTVDKYKQMVDVITSANNEYFFYGKEIFTKHRTFFNTILQQEPFSLYVNESTLPDWNDLIERFRRASDHIKSSN